MSKRSLTASGIPSSPAASFRTVMNARNSSLRARIAVEGRVDGGHVAMSPMAMWGV